MKKVPAAGSSGNDASKQALREQAEAKFAQSPDIPESLPPDEIQITLHELRVHQIELEMQNEELRTAQTEIEAGRARYYDLYDLAPVGYCTLSEKGLILEANLTVASLLGTDRDALIKQTISSFILKDDQDIYYLHRKKLFETGEPQECELRMVKQDGAFFWAHLTKTAAQAEDGAPVCRVAIGDITERKRAEEALREEAERLDHVLRATGTGIDIIDGDFNLHFVDRNWQKSYGDPAGRKCYEYFNGFSEPCPGCGITKALKTKLPVVTEEVLLREKNRPVEVRIIPFQDAEGKWLVAEINIDVSDRKRAETYREMGREILQILNEPGDLKESIQRVLLVLKTRTGCDAAGLRLQDGEDFPYFVQDGFSRDFLQTESTLVERGKDGGVCRDKDGNVCLECTCGLVISGKTDPANPLFTQGGSCWTNDSFPLVDLTSDQDPRLHPRNNCIHQGYASVALIPIRSSDRIVGLIQINDKRKGCFTLEMIEILEGIAAHIGSALMRKQAEEERGKLQDQLQQAQKMESVGRLAGGVAHDFNNMLGIILGYTELALDRVEPNEPLHTDLGEIRKAAQRSADLTRQLLAFASKQTIVPKVLDLNETAEGMLSMLRRLIGESINLGWKPGRGLWPVKMDSTQINQILVNLCVNARDAIAGVGRISVETRNTVLDEEYCSHQVGFTPGEYVKLTVIDDGCGMDHKTCLLIFDPFFTTRGMGNGTGLGLAIVYGIVKQNNGLINVCSEPEQGTTFNIYLPRYAAETEPLPRQVTSQTVSRGVETILLVEDEPAILEMTMTMLERQGYTVLTAGSPGEAIRLAREYASQIDMVLTDVVMPEMNGRDLAKELLSICPKLKCLFMSGYTADIIAHREVLDEGEYFIQKPFSLKELTAKLREVLESSSPVS